MYWPAMLLSAGLPPPTDIVVHGFLTRAGRRMSKSLGIGVDPAALARSWGADAVRYWLLHEVPPSGDADYTDGAFARVYATDLANNLGNLVQRTVSMIHRFRAGVVPAPAPTAASHLAVAARAVPGALHRGLDEAWDPRLALDAIFALASLANRAVAETKPWVLARDEHGGDADARHRLDSLLWELAETLRVIAETLRPLLPETSDRLAAQIGLTPAPDWCRALQWGEFRPAPASVHRRHSFLGAIDLVVNAGSESRPDATSRVAR